MKRKFLGNQSTSEQKEAHPKMCWSVTQKSDSFPFIHQNQNYDMEGKGKSKIKVVQMNNLGTIRRVRIINKMIKKIGTRIKYMNKIVKRVFESGQIFLRMMGRLPKI